MQPRLLGCRGCPAGAFFFAKNADSVSRMPRRGVFFRRFSRIFSKPSQKMRFWAFLGSKMVQKKVEFEGVGPIWRDPRRNSVQKAVPGVPYGGMATHLVTKRCDFGSLGVPGPASTPKPTNQPTDHFFHHHQPCVAIMCLTQGPIWPIFSSSSAMCGQNVSQFGLICFILIRFSKQWFQLGDPPV